MSQRSTWTLGIVIAASLLGAVHGQTPDCDPVTRACFDVRVDLPISAETSPRQGYERPTVNRYQNQEVEIYRQSADGPDAVHVHRDRRRTGTVEPGRRTRHRLEHIVALAEAHDSGLSTDDLMTFSGDPLNLTLATPHENRTVKGDRDAADYLPANNQCWFAGRVIAVKQRWGLSVDEREAQFLKTALAGCTPEQIARPVCEASTSTRRTAAARRLGWRNATRTATGG